MFTFTKDISSAQNSQFGGHYECINKGVMTIMKKTIMPTAPTNQKIGNEMSQQQPT